MNKSYLAEAFQELKILTEEDFNLSNDNAFTDMDNFTHDMNDFEKLDIIDPEAEEDSDIQDSYEGKVVCECVVCHSMIYRNPEDVIVDEEEALVNIGDECEYCHSADGYKVVGQIKPLSVEDIENGALEQVAEEEPIADDIEDMGEADVEEEPVEESLNTKEDLKEGFEKISIETEDQVMDMTQDDAGKITVSTEPKVDVIVPIDAEVKSEMSTNDEVEAEAEEANAVDEIDFDVDDFDEESFDELGESYLKKNYENVESFKTSSVTNNANKLVVEGIIKFNSGNEKKTAFIFEGRQATKKGKVKFIGENQQISRGKKSFTLIGNINDKKLIAESLNYNYKAKNAEGKSVRLYGTVKKAVNEAVDLVSKDGTIAHALNTPEAKQRIAAAGSDINALKQAYIDVIKDSNCSDNEKEYGIKCINAVKNQNALLSTLATFMTGMKSGK